MKNLITLILICLALSGMAQNPTYKVVNGKVIATTKQDTVKKPDPIIQVVNGVNFYRGSKGGIYCWVISKAGKPYKHYVKQS